MTLDRSAFAFVPSTDPRLRPGPGLWFAFRRRELLLGAEFALPRGASLEALGLSPTRAQFLGHLDDEPCYSAELGADVEPPRGMQFHGLRQLYGRLPESLMALAGRAAQIVEWDRTHQFCGACAAPTTYHEKLCARVCASCRLEFYPRLSPAMIAAVERGPEILLAHGARHPPGIYSVLAGFVDPGESVEDAVHREVYEETGIRVHNVRYFGSQPWPFPNSLMLAFQADYLSGEVTPDPEEIEDAAFFHAERLPPTFAGHVSISQWLLHDFLRRQGREPPAP